LARDLGRLTPSYEVVGARAFDLFPQTAHVEVVVVLERTAAAVEVESVAESETESVAESERDSVAEPESDPMAERENE
jgi:hypothetical protein